MCYNKEGGPPHMLYVVVYELVNSSLTPYLDRSMRYIGYIRVSTDLQDVGIEVQREAISSYANRINKEIDKFYVDENISGGVEWKKRKGLSDLLSYIQSDDIVLVQKRDRLGRDIFLNKEIENAIDQRGASIRSTLGEGMDSDAPESKMLRLMLDVFSTYEREIISQRIKKGMKIKKDRGEQVGSIRYGQMLQGKLLIPCPEEQEIMKLIIELRSNKYSCPQVAHVLNEKSSTLRGSPWTGSTVSYVSRISKGTYRR